MDNRYIIIGRSTCQFCAHADDFCKSSGLESVFLDYVGKEEILEEYKEFYQQSTVPIILQNNLTTGETKKIGGYSDLLGLFS